MSTKAIRPALTDSLRSLAECQLQMQVSRSLALDAGALGVMAIDAAVTAIVIGTKSGDDLWILALVLLGLSFGLAARAERLTGAEETGPLIDDVFKAGETEEDEELERSLLRDLAADLQTNRRALAPKGLLLDRAQAFLVAAIFVEMAGRVVQ